MYRWIETIRTEGGAPQHLALHQARMERTLLHFGHRGPMPVLADIPALRSPAPQGILKVHIDYDMSGITGVKSEPYVMRRIRRLRLVEARDIDYTYKAADRRALEALLALRGEADEVIIVRRALITDTSYSNLAFRSRGQWYTPATPLLRGTMRESLLACGLLREANITPADLPLYDAVCLINAMMPLGRMTLPIDSII